MPVIVPTIETQYWSPKLGSFGEVVENIDDIEQCIKIILTTPKGSDPHRPEFASGIFDYLDYPQTEIKPFLIREVFESLLTWEPRINVIGTNIVFNEGLNLGKVDLEVRWSVKNSILEGLTVVTI